MGFSVPSNQNSSKWNNIQRVDKPEELITCCRMPNLFQAIEFYFSFKKNKIVNIFLVIFSCENQLILWMQIKSDSEINAVFLSLPA